MLFIFLLGAVPPSLGQPLFFFTSEELGISGNFLAAAGAASWGAMLAGGALYQRVCARTGCGHRAVWRWAQVALCACTMLNWVQVTRLNASALPWLPEHFFLLGGDILETVVHRFQLMPFLVMAAKLCPPGIEGVLFATFMSLSNFSHQCAGFSGAALARHLGIVRKAVTELPPGQPAQAVAQMDYSSLPAALVVRAVLILVPLLFLDTLVPESFTPPDIHVPVPVAKKDPSTAGTGHAGAKSRRTRARKRA